MAFTRILFRAAGGLAAVTLAGIAALILAQIAARLIGAQIKSSDDFAGWLLAASLFLALPMTLNAGAHIRVTVLSDALPARARLVLDALATLIGATAAIWAAWQVLKYVRESWVYGDVSQGLVAVPLWIPQLAMAVGMVLFAIALVERLTLRLTGRATPDDSATQGAVE